MSIKAITDFLKNGETEEVRRSAAVVLGELGEAAAAKPLLQACKDADATVRLAAIRSLGKIKAESALDLLLEKFQAGGEEGEAASHSAAKLGARGARGLVDLLGKVSPGLRRYIAAALAAAVTAPADEAAIRLLSDTDPGVVETTTSALIHSLHQRPMALQKKLANAIQGLAKTKGISQATDQAVTRLLSALGDPSGNKALWERIQPSHPAEVRAAALQSLGKHALKPDKDQVRNLVQCACSRDFPVAAPALVLLQRLNADKKTLLEWFPLFRGHDPAARMLAIEKLGSLDQKEVAQALAEQARNPDKGVREAAVRAAAKSKPAQKALLDSLLSEGNYDYAWNLARLIAHALPAFSHSWYSPVLEKVLLLVENQDRLADPLLFLLRDFAGDQFKEDLQNHATVLRKKKKYEQSAGCLRQLTRDPGCPLDTRLDLACCLLKLSNKSLDHESRAANPALHHFISLAHREDFPLLDSLKKRPWLDADDLYFIGFHLAEEDNRASRKAAAQILSHVVKKTGKGKIAQAAKQKIKTSMLEE